MAITYALFYNKKTDFDRKKIRPDTENRLHPTDPFRRRTTPDTPLKRAANHFCPVGLQGIVHPACSLSCIPLLG